MAQQKHPTIPLSAEAEIISNSLQAAILEGDYPQVDQILSNSTWNDLEKIRAVKRALKEVLRHGYGGQSMALKLLKSIENLNAFSTDEDLEFALLATKKWQPETLAVILTSNPKLCNIKNEKGITVFTESICDMDGIFAYIGDKCFNQIIQLHADGKVTLERKNLEAALEKANTLKSSEKVTNIINTLKKLLSNKEEITKNSRILFQSHNNKSGAFSLFPPEILTKIASLLGNNDDIIEHIQEDYDTACKNFNKPEIPKKPK